MIIMKILLLIILTQYAVKCDDTSNYYVIEIPEDDPPRDFKKPFRIYWNVPTMQCKSKKIPFHLESYGIIQNEEDSFRGESVTILYDPGLFPALLKNESSGELKFRNGGVPQEGDIDLHLEAFKASMDQSIPDEDFSGVGIIDFESWRPVFRQNFGVLVPYKDVSYEIEKKKHWWWLKEWIQAEAKQRFEEAARSFMQTTLSVAKQMRPKALWGYYGFPYCFNMASNNMMEDCSSNVKKENDKIYWLWSESTALYPSVYSSRDLSASQLASLIRGRVREASRVRRKTSPILPYFWFRYRDGGFMSEVDLSTALKALYKSDASGFIIWGSSNDVNTVEKCMKLRNYVEKVLGPAIAKYTKETERNDDEMLLVTESVDYNETSSDSNIVINASSTVSTNTSTKSTTVVNTKFIPIDPEYPWVPPVNYSQEISDYVEKELSKKGEYNKTQIDDKMFASINDSLLMDIILNSLFHTKKSGEDINLRNSTINFTNDSRNPNDRILIETTTQINTAGDVAIPPTTSKYVIETEKPYIFNISTKNPLEHDKIIPDAETTTELNLASDEDTPTKEIIKKTEAKTITDKDIKTTTDSFTDFTNQFTEEMEPFYNDETLFDAKDYEEFITDETTEHFTLSSTNTPDLNQVSTVDNIYTFDNDVILNISSTATEEEGWVTISTDSAEIETSTNFESTEFIIESTDILKKLKKDSTGFGRELLPSNSTNLLQTENPESEQVVIYIA